MKDGPNRNGGYHKNTKSPRAAYHRRTGEPRVNSKARPEDKPIRYEDGLMASVKQACHRWLMQNDPTYAHGYRQNLKPRP